VLQPSAPAQGYLAHAWAALCKRLTKATIFMAVMCAGIALVLAAMDGHIGAKFVYSFSIGLSCWVIIDGTRLLVAWMMDAARVRRGDLPDPKGFHLGWTAMVPMLLAGNAAGALLGLRIADALTGNRSESLLDLTSPGTRITAVVTIVAGISALFSITTMERLAAARANAEAAQRQAAEARLKLLESQLEPHMLFNTLANLRVLIQQDPSRAQAMLDHLIAYLRSTLDGSRSAMHPLAAEFERAGDYLALMAVRMGPRLTVVMDLPNALRAVPVPPMLLQPLVENSIKHGLEPKVAPGRIELRAWGEHGVLKLSVRDTGIGPATADATRSPPTGAGFGTAQVRERLTTLYGERASLEITPATDAEGGTLAVVTLPTEMQR
jgi:sensor histidine kinase YesM